jgi:hypothetical protein
MLKRFMILLGAIAVVVTSCTVVTYQQQAPTPKSQLQISEFQTREFDTNDTRLILKAVINVLQDDGFIVKNADQNLGLLFATKEVDLQNRGNSNSSSNDYWATLIEGMIKNQGGNRRNNNNEPMTYQKLKTVESSINITEMGSRSKVRANFQAKILDNKGNTMEVYSVDDQKFYQDFFSKVDKGIFLQKQGLR